LLGGAGVAPGTPLLPRLACAISHLRPLLGAAGAAAFSKRRSRKHTVVNTDFAQLRCYDKRTRTHLLRQARREVATRRIRGLDAEQTNRRLCERQYILRGHCLPRDMPPPFDNQRSSASAAGAPPALHCWRL